MHIRDRVRELRRVRAADLRPHPNNWRTHPPGQQQALRGVLAQVGYADALVARELPDGSLQLVDGHLRAETTPDAVVPVLVVDLDDQEADLVLLTHDPLAAMAGVDPHELAALAERCAIDSEAVQDLVDSLQGEPNAELAEPVEIELPELFQLVVECDGEAEQRSLYERLRSEGFTCRVLSL